MKRKKTVILLFLILAAAIGAFLWYRHATRIEPLVLYGNVDIRETQLAFNATERIEELNVDEGDRVKKGEVLGKLNTEALNLAISKCKADIRSQQAILDKVVAGSRPEEISEAEANVNQARAKVKNAEVSYRRIENLYASGAVSQQTRDNAEEAYKMAAASLNNLEAARNKAVNGSRKEDIAAQRAKLDSLKDQLKTYEYQLSQATLIAPQDGVIRSRLLEVGDMASPNKPVYLLSIDTKKWVRVYVPESRLGELYEGKPARITIDSQKAPLTGQVGYISNTAEFTPKNVQTEELRTSLLYEVRVMADDPDNVLRMGMPATVTF